ncbi:sensor histidine kinase [Fluviicola taffensis]|uniref:histidine kinase n=1 Tax=Fluviicola taffensis (strain DSM 16823 / NCIMB 13979 / RW262) TaxID=755732 RepID=F2IBS1_FLUTR|nr:sensor histidine kinase [Fluviicola taffensis]AEA45397.1 signal transduction histidine kinase [Fluviicola taffensis DSM 16823]
MDKLNTNWLEFHEKSKFRLVLHLLYFFAGLMSIVTIVNFSNEHFSAMPNFIAVGMCILGLFVLYITKNYRLVGAVCSILTLGIVSGSFLFLKATHYLTPMWMIVNIMFTFFILGKKWGISILIAHFMVLFYYLINIHERNIVAVESFSGNDVTTFILEYSIVGFAIAYILNLYVRTTSFSRINLEENNQILTDQNKVISKQNSEMEVMLREIHHRVKNNLQIITSLLRLQANNMTEKDSGSYQEAIDRINAMAIIHEKMYQSGSLSKFDLEKYFKSLINSLLTNYSVDKHPQFSIEVELEDMKSKSIVPLALLMNELLLNSLKHAFRNQDYPKISIVLSRIEDEKSNQFLLEYNDNGKWIEGSTSAFGTEIIQAMTEQMEGELELTKTDLGTFYVFHLANLS